MAKLVKDARKHYWPENKFKWQHKEKLRRSRKESEQKNAEKDAKKIEMIK